MSGNTKLPGGYRRFTLIEALGDMSPLQHKHDTSMTQFMVLERIVEDPKGGNIDKKILQWEARWIFSLNATSPPGLNEALSYKPFLG